MNFEQAKEYSFLVPWKTMECFSGPDCWCRMVVPIEPIKYDEYCKNVGATIYREYDVIVDAAAIDKETAEYIVKLHNENHERTKQNCRDAMKATIDSLISVTITNNPTIDDFRTIKKKEID